MSITRIKNRTFKGEEPTWANACVGNNGNPQIIEYANGFANAANLLIDSVIQDEGLHLHVDEFIYPICFNMRHAVELHLKGTIEKLIALAGIRNRTLPDFSLASTHDLRNIWNYVKSNTELIDKRYLPLINNLDEFIIDIATVDSSGQVFRYPFDTENRKHLVDVEIINVIVLKQRFNILEDLLSELNRLNNLLVDEYSCGSFTTKLSRAELFELAVKLPKKSQWTSESFITAKASLLTEYGLSSNDFCRALNIIKNNYELAQLIDAVPPLHALTEPILHTFFDGWIKLHHFEKASTPGQIIEEINNERTLDFRPYLTQRANAEQWWHENCQLFSLDHIAELNALYYFSIDLPYSEYFELSRKRFAKEHIKHDQYDIKRSVFHLLNKATTLREILNTLKFLGQNSLVKSLEERYILPRETLI